MIRLLPNLDYPHEDSALTLRPNHVESAHASGWVIEGEIYDHMSRWAWVSNFTANHLIYGKVDGNFDIMIEATSKEAFDHFWGSHKPESWDYQDI